MRTKFNITRPNRATIVCRTANDIYNTVMAITDDIYEASNIWKQAGHLAVSETINQPLYSIKRIA